MGSAASAGKVMVIDDSVTVRRNIEIILREAGYEVILAEDGFDALAKAVDHRPDLILADVMMPRLDGYQMCSVLKHHCELRAIPLVLLTSKGGLFDQARGRMVGSDGYLVKPVSREELVRAARYFIIRGRTDTPVSLSAGT